MTVGSCVNQKITLTAVKRAENYQEISAKVVFVPRAKPITFNISGLEQTYGSVSAVTVTPSDAGVTAGDYEITYNGAATLPQNAGTYRVKVVSTNSNYSGSASETLVIQKGTAEKCGQLYGNRHHYR